VAWHGQPAAAALIRAAGLGAEQAVTGHSFDDGEAYEQFMGRWSHEIGKAFLTWLQPPEGAHWLDVGCGTGIFTELISDTCAPASVIAIDPSESQIARARTQVTRTKTEFHLADAQELPFPDKSFDIVASALVVNFVPNKARAMSEMRRVVRPGGLIAACVWNFAAELSPSGPLRRAMRRIGIEAPPIPGTDTSSPAVLADLLEKAGLKGLNTDSIEVAVSFRDFDDFWHSQTPHYAPTTSVIAAMSLRDRLRLMEAARDYLQPLCDGVGYSAWAIAVKGYCPT
jgi:ubiquinone/menaquinone biosynthesis C-methylase UbiE